MSKTKKVILTALTILLLTTCAAGIHKRVITKNWSEVCSDLNGFYLKTNRREHCLAIQDGVIVKIPHEVLWEERFKDLK